MNKYPPSALFVPLSRRFPRAAVLFSLTAVISGILAMHVWMGGHGASHAVGPVVTAAPAADVHHRAITPASASDSADSGMTLNLDCGDTCGEEIAAGVCILAFLVVSFATAIVLRSRLVYGRVRLRGPPPVVQLPRTFVPSLTLVQLCISRT
ncbi:hypothetical protein SAMN04488693_12815 [Arthrobacter subterraneus]|uniref:Uncharacterized protein n=1 Tax=Arthrobacter subterraneus TaxID=335973 RepID=A0A1G8P1F8_9MICC|nr:hypothetical protein [Arthrobacter subterraneus]SDI86088.1 hypothetical protein SAMN04488693_12815 [Arthrobacter subterraneus]